MTAHAPGPWYEVQGLALCPVDDHPNDHCHVPDKGEWHGIYHFATEREARAALAYVLDSDDPIYDRWDDFRIAAPAEVVVKTKRRKAA